jgi:predicted dithiol-disulfide oxidoreductase (DUF899 family)
MTQPRFPNESTDYRTARDKLLEREIALRAEVERVAAERRKLPAGGALKEDYPFEELVGSQVRTVRLSELFSAGKSTLLLYSFMYGPKMERPCPMCTSFLDGMNAQAEHVGQRIAFAVAAKSPIDRIQEFAAGRGWNKLRLLSSAKTTYNVDYFGEDEKGRQMPMANVYVKRDGKVLHSWGSEMLYADSERGADSRHIDMMWPLWNTLDLTPEGRGADWYPRLQY